MKIYSNSMYGRGTVFVSPGRDHPETSEWIRSSSDGEGRPVQEPVQFTVTFKAGMAEVPENLGKYMIAHKLAVRSPLILPASFEPNVDDGRPKYAKPIEVGRPLTP